MEVAVFNPALTFIKSTAYEDPTSRFGAALEQSGTWDRRFSMNHQSMNAAVKSIQGS
jgi:hypothetical protein